jgi:hypothetical protein
MKKILPEISLFVLIAFLNMLSACNYYLVNTVQPMPSDSPTVKNVLAMKKYFILHQGDMVWHMTNMAVNEDKQELTCSTVPLPEGHLSYLKTKATGVNRYKKSMENPPTYEVHIYISEHAELDSSQFMIPVSSIQKIDIYDQAVGATTASYVFTTLGIIAGACVILLVILILTKSSCPFVYTNDGTAFHFTGEMYGGAIYSPLERDDYMPLPGFKAVDNQYQLKISNELLEKQYTDLAELMVVQHPLHSKVIIDKNGDIQTILSPSAPVKAISLNHVDYTNPLSFNDGSSFLFNEDGAKEDAMSSVTMTFKKPIDAKSAKLVINAKNSYWLDYMYGKFNELFGTSFNKFSEKQKNAPAERMINWQLSQGIPLKVYIETQDGWKFVDYFNSVGPLASRDLVMPIDVSEIKGESVNIRLECGFMFWEVDYAAMDFSKNIPVEITRLVPTSAMDEKGHDVSALLKASDKKYLIQPEVGDEVVVTYPGTAVNASHQQTAFLHSRGYYEYIRDYKTKPDVAYLKSFRQEGAFTRFSKDNYTRFVTDKKLVANALTDGDGK